MGRPSMAAGALCRNPAMETRRADAPGVEGVPAVAAIAGPEGIRRRHPAAQRTPDARAFRSGGLLVFNFGYYLGFVHGGPCQSLSLYTTAGGVQRGCAAQKWETAVTRLQPFALPHNQASLVS